MPLGYPLFTDIGEELVLTGTGFKPGVPIVLYLDDQKILAQESANNNGSFQHRSPVNLPLGMHTIEARQQLGKKISL